MLQSPPLMLKSSRWCIRNLEILLGSASSTYHVDGSLLLIGRFSEQKEIWWMIGAQWYWQIILMSNSVHCWSNSFDYCIWPFPFWNELCGLLLHKNMRFYHYLGTNIKIRLTLSLYIGLLFVLVLSFFSTDSPISVKTSDSLARRYICNKVFSFHYST